MPNNKSLLPMSEYRVLARKYRPKDFDDLIGQEVLVRTLSNAIAQNRLAHAFLLTGIRGIGKTTTARIIARALNCIGEDGQGSATIRPCGVCPNCIAIMQDRHVDVMEMDAASRTGVDDIREIIDTVHYAPANARYKIYIIDEVHMLSKNAFNALLKTLEEPPPHVKFIFATTEIRKIPVTILSRCQRFDLKRIDRDGLAVHLGNICAKESVTADDAALSMIATAAEGSVRDALSLLDQAIAHASQNATPHITEALTATMLGLSDKTRNYALLEKLFAGDIAAALDGLRDQYAAGSDPVQIMQELLEHLLTLQKTGVAPSQTAFAPEHQALMQKLAADLPLTILTRIWQMLLKGLQECQHAPNPLMAAEMVLIRLAHLSELPSPEELIRKIKSEGIEASPVNTPRAAAPSATVARSMTQAAPMMMPASEPDMFSAPVALAQPQNFDEVLALFEQKKEIILHRYLDRDASLVSFRSGALEINFSQNVPQDVIGKISQKLTEWTGQRWMLTLSQAQGEAPRYTTRQTLAAEKMEAARNHPLVAEVLQLFSGAILTHVESGETQ
jgi:DNA polymerase-3 subunit gamma/tau